jgi:sodium-independent sulfate anion transporter 11
MSITILLFCIIKARGCFLDKVEIYSIISDHPDNDQAKYSTLAPNSNRLDVYGVEYSLGRSIFLPIKYRNSLNPSVRVHVPYPGIFIYRFSKGFNYLNANHYLDYLVSAIFKKTRQTNADTYRKLGVSVHHSNITCLLAFFLRRVY